MADNKTILFNEGQFSSEHDAVHKAPVRILNNKSQMCFNQHETLYMVFKEGNGSCFEYAIDIVKLHDAIKSIASMSIEGLKQQFNKGFIIDNGR